MITSSLAEIVQPLYVDRMTELSFITSCLAYLITIMRFNLQLGGHTHTHTHTHTLMYHDRDNREAEDELGVEPVQRLEVLVLVKHWIVNDKLLSVFRLLAPFDMTLDLLLKLWAGPLLRNMKQRNGHEAMDLEITYYVPLTLQIQGRPTHTEV